MSENFTVKISGLDDLQKKLEALPDELQTKSVRAAVLAGGKVVKDEMVLLAPKNTGLLSEHFDIKTKKQRGGTPDAVSAFVGPNGKEVIHPQQKGKTAGLPRTANMLSKFLEFGTSREGKKPFLTQAFEVSKSKALDTMISKLREFFDRYK